MENTESWWNTLKTDLPSIDLSGFFLSSNAHFQRKSNGSVFVGPKWTVVGTMVMSQVLIPMKENQFLLRFRDHETEILHCYKNSCNKANSSMKWGRNCVLAYKPTRNAIW
jgi:hypothetical protein